MPRDSTPRIAPIFKTSPEAGIVVPGRGKHGFHAAARIRCAADDLNRIAVADIDHADAELVRVRMLLGGDHVGDDEGREQCGLVFDAFDFEADFVQLLGNLRDRGVGRKIILQPGEGELHVLNPPASVGKSSGLKP
jgi:hypothetical protein